MNETNQTPSPTQSGVALQLRAVAGKETGVVRSLESLPVTVGKQFEIFQKGPWLMVRSLSDKDLMIDGEFFAESIIENGTAIDVPNGEYRIESLRTINENRQKVVRSLSFAAFALIIIGIFFPYAFPNASPWPAPIPVATADHWWQSAMDLITPPPPPQVVEIQPPPLTLIPSPLIPDSQPPASIAADSPKGLEIISVARLRMGVADQFLRDSPINVGNIYWAILELDSAEQILSVLTPAPPMLNEVRQKRDALVKQQNHDLRATSIRINIAIREGRMHEAQQLARRMMAMSPNIESAAYQWAAPRANLAPAN